MDSQRFLVELSSVSPRLLLVGFEKEVSPAPPVDVGWVWAWDVRIRVGMGTMAHPH